MSDILTAQVWRSLALGTAISIELTLLSYTLAIILGLFVAIAKLSKFKGIRILAQIYIDFFRGVPVLVQILFAYFATPQLFTWANDGVIVPLQGLLGHWIPMFPSRLTPFWAAALALSLGYAAYIAEVFRAGIQAIPRGQTEAAASIGLTQAQILRYVVLPQAIKIMIPPLANSNISLLKDSSLASVISVAELVLRNERIIEYNYQPLVMWTVAAGIYLVLSVMASFFFKYIERLVDPDRRIDLTVIDTIVEARS